MGRDEDIVTTVNSLLDEFFKENEQIISKDGPKLDPFTPEANALLAPLWKPQRKNVPAREAVGDQSGFLSKKRPSFLLHGLDDTKAPLSQPGAHKHISEAQAQGPSFLYGTSGAGKTRSVFEYLSRYKGFYFLAHDFVRNPGSKDLMVVLEGKLKETQLGDTFADVSNRAKIKERLSMLLLVRYAVHEKLTEFLNKEEMTPYEWLLYQLFPTKFLGGDIFHRVLNECINRNLEINSSKDFDRMQFSSKPEGVSSAGSKVVWSVFVDEAQALLEMKTINFLSKDGKIARSAFSALVEGFGLMPNTRTDLHSPLFSGTGLAFDQFSEQKRSITGKSLGEVTGLFFSNFKLLSAEGVEGYLSQILDRTSVSDAVIKHVANWLRGRPRWTAGFLEVYNSRSERDNHKTKAWSTKGEFEGKDAKLMEALDRYLNVMTRGDGRKRRESWTAEGASAYACFERVSREFTKVADESDRHRLNQVEYDLKSTLLRFAVGQKAHIFADADAKLLIENGVAAVHAEDSEGEVIEGHLDEPIVIESGMNFFNLDTLLRQNLQNQESDGQGQAFEKLLLPGLLMEKDKLHGFVQKHLKDPGASALKDYYVSTRSAYGVLCVDTSEEIDDTIKWMENSVNAKFEGQVAPFCYPDNNIGPDLLSLLRSAKQYEDFRAFILQSKFVTEMRNQQDALRTLLPGKLYYERRGKDGERVSKMLTEELVKKWNAVKDKFISDERPCLRMLVQRPAPTTSSAVSGIVAADATGPKSKSIGTKRDWLIVLDDKKSKELFSEKSDRVAQLIKRPKII